MSEHEGHSATASIEGDSIRKLFVIYGMLPKINCIGKCADVCGIVEAEAIEEINVKMFNRINGFPQRHFLTRKNQRVIKHFHAKHTNENDGCLTCPYLQKNRECSIYYARPLVCRLFGLTEELRCPHGCLPERFLTRTEVMTFMKLVKDIIPEGY